MPTQPNIILAINPGTRYLGFAIIKQGKLIDWGVSVIEERSPEDRLIKAKVIVSKYFSKHSPGILVLKSLHPALQSQLLKHQRVELEQWAYSRGCQVLKYSISEVKAFLLPKGHTNKHRLAEYVSDQYPSLIHEYRKEQDAFNPYHTRMFEAVALASVADALALPKPTYLSGSDAAVRQAK